MLLLPNRHAMLHLIDDEAAGIEGFAAVCGTHADPHRHLAQLQRADSMDAQRLLYRESPQGFGDDAVAFLDRQFLKSFVLQPGDFLTLVKIPHPALETDVAARAQSLQLAPRAFGVDGRLSKAKMHQPPATGGMNTTASPILRGRDQSLTSLSPATFNCSRDSVKPYRATSS